MINRALVTLAAISLLGGCTVQSEKPVSEEQPIKPLPSDTASALRDFQAKPSRENKLVFERGSDGDFASRVEPVAKELPLDPDIMAAYPGIVICYIGDQTMTLVLNDVEMGTALCAGVAQRMEIYIFPNASR
ncbi:MAG: hypothetical protein AAFX04_02675 [Pseudomonadota bacterium]